LQKTIKYANIFYSKALKNVPKLIFFGEKLCRLAALCRWKVTDTLGKNYEAHFSDKARRNCRSQIQLKLLEFLRQKKSRERRKIKDGLKMHRAKRGAGAADIAI
jgi:hypothetical protein